MEMSTFEQMGGTYRQEGDYLLPNLTVRESIPVGIWGQRRKRYLQKYRKPLYTALLLNGKLDDHLADTNQQAEDIFSQLVKQMVEQEGITERLKSVNQMEWTGCMNNIRDRAIEIINAELIFT